MSKFDNPFTEAKEIARGSEQIAPNPEAKKPSMGLEGKIEEMKAQDDLLEAVQSGDFDKALDALEQK